MGVLLGLGGRLVGVLLWAFCDSFFTFYDSLYFTLNFKKDEGHTNV